MDGVRYLTDHARELGQKRDFDWDRNKTLNLNVSDLYGAIGYSRAQDVTSKCALRLEFAQVVKDDGSHGFKLERTWFCKNRFCPLCQKRRSMIWSARFMKAVPDLLVAHSDCRFIFLTLTVQNCPIGELRSTISEMNTAWVRLTKLKAFPAMGWLKSVEVTRGKDGSAHPHFHILLMVPASYFKSKRYLSHARWVELWKQCLRINYTPVCNVKAVKQAKSTDEIHAAIRETVKYSVKPQDLVEDVAWFEQLVCEMHGLKTVSLGGNLRNFLREEESEDLVHGDDGELDDDDTVEEVSRFIADWFHEAKRYAMRYKT